MFIASPSRISPGVRCVDGGRNEFGMLRNRPCAMAAAKLGRTQAGRVGRTTFWRWFFTPPAEGAAEGR